jgi:hypothetical protein
MPHLFLCISLMHIVQQQIRPGFFSSGMLLIFSENHRTVPTSAVALLLTLAHKLHLLSAFAGVIRFLLRTNGETIHAHRVSVRTPSDDPVAAARLDCV